ncbi:phage tail protein [Aeromonas enteropelogenes]|uniref:phage tail protein n=1 Tax=Aeromonas enteropelogenes TaxID=29489 RepID=UPI003F7444CE
MSTIYSAILTNAGEAKMANALALGIPMKITQMAVGDGNGLPVTPDPAMTAIPGEQRRAPINTLFADPLNPAQLVAEQIIPENVGGWWIRCIGLYDDEGTLIAIANAPDTYKPLLTSGAGRTQVIRIVLIVSDTSAVELKIDPSVVLATRKYVDDVMKAHKESSDHPAGTKTRQGMLRLATDAEAKARENDSSAMTPKGVELAISARHLKSGAPLPTTDIGPIWHHDYGGWMIWQEFTANGADYRGYASQLIGSLLLDTQPTPRQGYIKSGVQNLSRVTYAALRAWAIHNGLMVAPGVWEAGTIQCADNPDGTTFRIYDVRGEFLRVWDDQRGVDSGRAFGSYRADSDREHKHISPVNDSSSTLSLQNARGSSWPFGSAPIGVPGCNTISSGVVHSTSGEDSWLYTSADIHISGESRPRSTALLADIKF